MAADVRLLLLQPRWLMRFILAWLIQPATALEHTVWYAAISSLDLSQDFAVC